MNNEVQSKKSKTNADSLSVNAFATLFQVRQPLATKNHKRKPLSLLLEIITRYHQRKE